AQANQDPFEITAVFLPVDDSHPYMTQAIEEQNTEGLSMFKARVAELNPGFDFITIFPGSTYRGFSKLLCGPVRVAGPVASPVPLFSVPSILSTRIPNPYANGPVGVTEPATFTASFNQIV